MLFQARCSLEHYSAASLYAVLSASCLPEWNAKNPNLLTKLEICTKQKWLHSYWWQICRWHFMENFFDACTAFVSFANWTKPRKRRFSDRQYSSSWEIFCFTTSYDFFVSFLFFFMFHSLFFKYFRSWGLMGVCVCVGGFKDLPFCVILISLDNQEMPDLSEQRWTKNIKALCGRGWSVSNQSSHVSSSSLLHKQVFFCSSFWKSIT